MKPCCLYVVAWFAQMNDLYCLYTMQISDLVKVRFIRHLCNYNDLIITIIDAGITEGQASFLTTSAVILIVACLLYLMVKVYIYRLYWRRQFRAIPGCRRTFLKDIYGVTLEHLYRVILNDIYSVVLYLCAIIFVFPVGHECWCFPSWKWQIGALALFMAWVNNFILLKDIPRFGRPITMLFNVYINFFWLIHLPILLILTFAFPFYMLFIATLEVCVHVCMS